MLNDNSNAYFSHGNISIPIQAGRLVTFNGKIPHQTVINSGRVNLLGPFSLPDMNMAVESGPCSGPCDTFYNDGTGSLATAADVDVCSECTDCVVCIDLSSSPVSFSSSSKKSSSSSSKKGSTCSSSSTTTSSSKSKSSKKTSEEEDEGPSPSCSFRLYCANNGNPQNVGDLCTPSFKLRDNSMLTFMEDPMCDSDDCQDVNDNVVCDTETGEEVANTISSVDALDDCNSCTECAIQATDAVVPDTEGGTCSVDLTCVPIPQTGLSGGIVATSQTLVQAI